MGCSDFNPIEAVDNAIESVGDRTFSPDLPDAPKPRDLEAERLEAERQATIEANTRRSDRRRRARAASLDTTSAQQRAQTNSSLESETRSTLG